MAGRTREIGRLGALEAGTPLVDILRIDPAADRWTVPDYAPRAEDREWCERELGDAPRRTTAETLADAGFPALGALVGMLRMRD